MPGQAWTGVLNQGTFWNGAGTVLNTATTAAVSPQAAATRDFPVQGGGQPYGWYVGQLIRVTARGFLTTTGSSGTLAWLLRANLNNLNSTLTTLATTAALTTGTGSLTTLQWKLEAFVRCTAIASSGSSVSTQGELTVQTNSTTPTLVTPPVNQIVLPMPNINGETAASVDTTQLQGIQLACTQVTSTCTVQLTEWVIEGLN